jgi:hypothetical protein
MNQEQLNTYQILCETFRETAVHAADFPATYFDELRALTAHLLMSDHGCLYELLQLHIKNNDLINLDALAEFTRGEGYFYIDYMPLHADIIVLMLSKALQLLEDSSAFSNWRIMRFVSTIYDIFFHQISLEEYPEVCAVLYFKLSKKILDPEWTPLYHTNWGYSQCVYFLQMAVYWFRKRENEFLILWQKIESQMNEGTGLLWEDRYWPEAYREMFGTSEDNMLTSSW